MRRFWIKIILVIAIFASGTLVGAGKVSFFTLHSPFISKFLQSRLAVCEKLPAAYVFDGSDKDHCYVTALVTMVRQYGLAVTAGTLRGYMSTNTGHYLQGQRCHAFGHEMGNEAVRSGISPHELFTQCIGMCSVASGTNTIEGLDLGCMNGAAHTWVLLNPDIREVEKICDDPTISQDIREGCYHGIGHGLSERYGGDVIREIDACKTLVNGRAQYQCAHAVFMEKQALLTHDGLPVNPSSYCLTLPTDMEPSCFEFAGFMEYSLTGGDVPQSLAVCDRVPSDMQSLCRNRVGQSAYLVRQHSQDVLSCLVADVIKRNDCMDGFVQVSIDTVNDVYGDHAFPSCALLPSMYQNRCYMKVGQVLRDRDGQSLRVSACHTVPDPEHQKACLSDTPL